MTLGLPLSLEDGCPFCTMPSRATEGEACVPPIPRSPRLAGHGWRKSCPALADSGITLGSNEMINEARTAPRGENGPRLPWSCSRQVVLGLCPCSSICHLPSPCELQGLPSHQAEFQQATLFPPQSEQGPYFCNHPLSQPPSGHALLALALLCF